MQDLKSFKLPREFWHSTQRSEGPPTPERFDIDISTHIHRWESWVVKLTFEKSGHEKHGNGFYVNVPNATFDVILTAGHNLVDQPHHYCSNIRIIHDPYANNDIRVTPDMVRVCDKYFDEPDELSAIYDYGAILLKRNRLERIRGFGFNLLLGLAPLSGGTSGAVEEKEKEKDVLHNKSVYVSGYAPQDSPPEDPPRRSEGNCIRTNSNQLVYSADTIQGMSGGPVWTGFRGVETVVAIHNYGAEKRGQGNKGSRLNLNVWRTIFGWLGLDWNGKSLHYRGSPTYSMHLYLPRASALGDSASNEARVRVGKPGRVETKFDIIPVAAKPMAKELEAGYGFLLQSTKPNPGVPAPNVFDWVRWESKKNKVSLTKRFDARCEVKIPQLIIQSGKPFSIQVRDEDSWRQIQMAMARLDEGDLELLEDDPQSFEDTSEVSFVPVNKQKLFELK